MIETNQPYTLMAKVVDVVVTFLVAVGVIALAGICGYIYARYI